MRDRLSRLPLWALLAIAATGSLMMGLGSPPQGRTALIWLSFVPIVFALEGVPPERRKRAFLVGFVGGLCVGLVGFPWIAELMVRFAELPWAVAGLGLLTFSAWTALPFGIWAVGYVAGPRTGWAAWVWPAVWWISVADVWPHLFPYTPMIGFAEVAEWMQVAELGGVPFVEAQVLYVGLAWARALLEEDRRRRITLGTIGLAIPLCSTAFGAWRLAAIDAEIEAARKVKVGIIQPNNALMNQQVRPRMRRLHSMSIAAAAEGAQMIVWPEAGAFPFAIERPFEKDSTRPSRQVLRGFALPVVFGAGTYSDDEEWERNSVYNMDAQGNVLGRFDKNVLVPIGEYVPIVDPVWVRSKIPAVSHNIAGDGPARFEIQPAATDERPDPGPPLHAGPLVCYEDIFPDFARQVARQEGGIDLFINVTIDTWFGDTAEPWEHLALAQFRCVEHRIPMVRSVSAGVSTAVDAGGRITAFLPVRMPSKTNPIEPERLVTDVALTRNTEASPTVFARVGWLIPWLCHACALLVLGSALLARLRKKTL